MMNHSEHGYSWDDHEKPIPGVKKLGIFPHMWQIMSQMTVIVRVESG